MTYLYSLHTCALASYIKFALKITKTLIRSNLPLKQQTKALVDHNSNTVCKQKYQN